MAVAKEKLYEKTFFGFILCATLIVSSMSVFAGSSSAYFGNGAASARATLSSSSGIITANTIHSGSMHVETMVRALGTTTNGSWAYGFSTASTTPSGADVYKGAESYHYCDAFSQYLIRGK